MEGKEASEVDNPIEERSQVDLEQGSRRRECLASWKTEIEELPQEMQAMVPDKMPSIWRINSHFRNKNLEDYEPKVVSIGPLPRGKQNLIPMDKTKLEILRSILNGRSDNTLDIFFDEIFQSLGDAREEYSEKIELTDEEFAKLLVIDGCFVIVLCSCRRDFGNIIQSAVSTKLLSNFTYSFADLFLLENQIPFFVINKLFQKLCAINPKLEESSPNFMSLLFKCMEINLPIEKYPKQEEVRHILHLLTKVTDPSLLPDETCRQSYWQKAVTRSKKKLFRLISMPFLGLFYLILFRDCSGLFRAPKRSKHSKVIPAATKLHETGMNFQMKAMPTGYNNACQLNISLRDGTFEIPQLSVDHFTCFLLRNLIAFEQCTYSEFSSHVTRYCILLDQLINTPEDVGILQQSGILENNLGSDFELAEMVNSLCKDVGFDKSEETYVALCKNVQKYYEVPHHKWRATLMRNYFQSPWTIFSVAAAVILVVFTVTQTLFTIYPRK